jgi:hypothetical protein
MTAAALAGLLLARPFRPFSFVLGDNTEIRVSDPNQVGHEPANPIVTLTWPGGAQTLVVLDLVASINVEAPPRRGWDS